MLTPTYQYQKALEKLIEKNEKLLDKNIQIMLLKERIKILEVRLSEKEK